MLEGGASGQLDGRGTLGSDCDAGLSANVWRDREELLGGERNCLAKHAIIDVVRVLVVFYGSSQAGMDVGSLKGRALRVGDVVRVASLAKRVLLRDLGSDRGRLAWRRRLSNRCRRRSR